MRPRRPRWVGVAGKGLLLLLGAFVAVALAELGTRLFFPDSSPRTAAISQLWQHDAELGWSHLPGASGSFNAFDREVHVDINSTGFRDRERSYARDPAKRRIVVLGDSMVWGFGVAQDEMFTALMEERRRDLEFVNLGVSGYGTDQELLLLQRDGLRYRPDLVILVFVRNDFQTNLLKKVYLVYQKPMFDFGGDGRLELQNVPVPDQTLFERTASVLVRHSFLLNHAARVYSKLRDAPSERTVASGGAAAPRPPFPGNSAEKITEAMIMEIRRLVVQGGAEFLLVLVDGMEVRGQEMAAFFESRQVRTLNLETAFPAETRKDFRLRDGAHWNAAGHRKVADELMKYLEGAALVDKPH